MVRILFGVVWGVDASLKWQPAFIDHLVAHILGALPGQPTWGQAWIPFWHHTVGANPRLFAYLVAGIETALAISLILGLLTNLFASRQRSSTPSSTPPWCWAAPARPSASTAG